MEYTRTTQQSVAWFRSRDSEGTIEKRPAFQRYFVWSRRQQSALIETILLGYPIPEIYMQEGLGPDNTEQYIVVDGQQRITTVLSFLDGQFKLDNEVMSPWGGLKASKLQESHLRQILQYQFVVRTLPAEWGEEKLRDVFSRLNRGVSALQDQELRHATYWGPFIRTMEELAADPRWDMLKVFTSTEVRRMADVEFISELVVAMLHGLQNKKDSLDDYYLYYEENGFEQEPDIRAAFDEILRVLVDIFEVLETRRWRKKSDFYSLFCLLYEVPALWHRPGDRERLVGLLDSFALAVDEALSRIGEQVSLLTAGEDVQKAPLRGLDDTVARYVLAVRGAASDLSARRARHDALGEWLSQPPVKSSKSRSATKGSPNDAAAGSKTTGRRFEVASDPKKASSPRRGVTVPEKRSSNKSSKTPTVAASPRKRSPQR